MKDWGIQFGDEGPLRGMIEETLREYQTNKDQLMEELGAPRYQGRIEILAEYLDSVEEEIDKDSK